MPILDDLRAAVRADGRTQAELAERAGMHVVSLSRFMQGHRDLSVRNLEALAAVLGYSANLRPAQRPG